LKIFSKKTFIFVLGSEEYPVQNESFAEVPDKLIEDKFFKAALKDGSVMVINSINKTTLENGDKTLDTMSVDELKNYAEKHEIDLGKSTSREGILSKIKLAES
jgi:hypothetical protein